MSSNSCDIFIIIFACKNIYYYLPKKLLLMLICSQLQLVLVGTNAAILPPQLYWKSMLPNSPMPKSISNLLHLGWYHAILSPRVKSD